MFAQVSLSASLTYRFSQGKVPMSFIVLVAELMAQSGRTFWQRAIHVLIKLNELANLWVKSGEFMVILTYIFRGTRGVMSE
jgi:hypothetical protein